MDPVVRRATVADIDDLLRLRAVMAESLWADVDFEGEWVAHARDDFAERLPELDGDLAAFVIDGPLGAPVSCAVGIIQTTIASSRRPDGRSGHVFNVATDVDYRGRGYATAIMRALLDWFGERGVELVDLNASEQAEGVYERLGFVPRPERSYSIRLTPEE